MRTLAPPATLLSFLALLCAAPGASAQTIGSVDVRGLDAPTRDNVRRNLSLVDAIGKPLSERRFDYLLQEAESETRRSLEPYGYFSPTIRIDETPADATAQTTVAVVVTVEAGAPVKVRRADIAVDGPGAGDAVVAGTVAAFTPGKDEVFDQVRYELAKARIGRLLADRGYLDADIGTHAVQVSRADAAADIALHWTSGPRYVLGEIEYTQSPAPFLRPDLLQKIRGWKPGTPYDQARLDALRESLQRLDYFSGIDIAPRRGRAVGNVVPIEVTLTPAKRSIYTAGLSYGSVSGPGVRLGLERRYLNARGHKVLAEVDDARKRKLLTLQYRIPAFAWLEGWYAITARAADEQTDYIDNRRVELIGSRSGRINDKWSVVAGLHLLRERWAYAAEDDGDPQTPPDYRYGSFVYPELGGDYVNVDQRLAPRRGFGGTALLRGAAAGLGSDASLLQVHADLRWFHGLGPQSRLIARGEVGYTLTNALVDLPPTLRFHAGGDRSIRGYGWREVGPRVGLPGHEFPIGAKHVVTASLEYETYFRDPWGIAVFVDTGSAFNDRPDWRTGIGVGLRWRSPVGPLRVDIARGLDAPDSPFQITLNLGAEL